MSAINPMLQADFVTGSTQELRSCLEMNLRFKVKPTSMGSLSDASELQVTWSFAQEIYFLV
jgi:hypothetical protein